MGSHSSRSPGRFALAGRARRSMAAALSAVLVAGSATACFDDASAMPAVRDFLIAWQVGNYEAAAGHTIGADRATVVRALGEIRNQLDAASMKLSLGVPVEPGQDEQKAIIRSGDEAQAVFSVKIDLGENGRPFSYQGRMRLRRVDGRWRVLWSPSIIHPTLQDGQRLAVVSQTQQRADIQDAQGRSLLREARVVFVGVYPGRLADPAKTIDQLAGATRFDGRRLDTERLIGRVRSAPPGAFFNLLMVQQSEHPGLLVRLRAIEGLQFQNRTVPIDAALAPELVGRLGPATADRLQAVGAPYQPGDTIGVSGLQFLFQRRLAGTPTVRVVALDPAGTGQAMLAEFDGLDQPEPVQTSLDRNVQRKAQAALKDLNVPASLVAVRANNGEVLAVANHKSRNQNLAMEGQYPPGHTFGIVAAEALMRSTGVTDADKTECPASTTVGGQPVTNPGPARPDATLQSHFAFSCATTLAQLSTRLSAPALIQAAGRFGFGKSWGLSVPAYSGSVPLPATDAEKAAAVNGQGKVQASPLAMALTAGAVATGTWRPPLLLQKPLDRQVLAPVPLEPGVIDDLQRLMHRSVSVGTAKAAKLPGAVPVHGVAATVNYPSGGKTRTVSWFVGYRGNVAFAVAIEGTVPAAQIAAKFLTGR